MQINKSIYFIYLIPLALAYDKTYEGTLQKPVSLEP